MRLRAQILHIGLVAALVLAAFFVRDAIPEPPAPATSLEPPDPIMLSIFTLGHETMAADLAWLDALQYFGDSKNEKFWFARLAGILDAVVALDPDFVRAYLFGGLALTSTIAGVEAADDLLLRGMERFADDWRFPFYIGVNAFLFREDQVRAADFFTQASHRPNAPDFLPTLASRLLSSAGECDKSLAMIAQLRRRTQDPMMQQRFDERYNHTVWECNFQLLEAAVASFRERHGSPPTDLDALIAAGVIPGLPQDPFGGQWGIDGQGRVTSTTRQKRLRVHLPKAMMERLR